MTVKVCGMRDAGNIRQVEQTGADLMGFIFYPRSKRCVTALPDYLPQLQQRVGVFVDETKAAILATASRFALSYIQLHGNESPAFCRELRAEGLRVIRALGIATEADARRAEAYAGAADLMVFDTPSPSHGGTGQRFNWQALRAYRGPVPFLLSGGIGPEAADDLLAFSHPMMAGVDLNSRFETAPGVKDAAALAQFIAKLKSAGK